MIAERIQASCKNRRGIAALKMKASDVQSVTLGINVNARFEAVSIGLVYVNKKPFRQSGIVSNFADAIASKDRIQETADFRVALARPEGLSYVKDIAEKYGVTYDMLVGGGV